MDLRVAVCVTSTTMALMPKALRLSGFYYFVSSLAIAPQLTQYDSFQYSFVLIICFFSLEKGRIEMRVVGAGEWREGLTWLRGLAFDDHDVLKILYERGR